LRGGSCGRLRQEVASPRDCGYGGRGRERERERERERSGEMIGAHWRGRVWPQLRGAVVARTVGVCGGLRSG
jgi:hypothetical protein